jgi:hypothetical protein
MTGGRSAPPSAANKDKTVSEYRWARKFTAIHERPNVTEANAAGFKMIFNMAQPLRLRVLNDRDVLHGLSVRKAA